MPSDPDRQYCPVRAAISSRNIQGPPSREALTSSACSSDTAFASFRRPLPRLRLKSHRRSTIFGSAPVPSSEPQECDRARNDGVDPNALGVESATACEGRRQWSSRYFTAARVTALIAPTSTRSKRLRQAQALLRKAAERSASGLWLPSAGSSTSSVRRMRQLLHGRRPRCILSDS